MQKVLRLALALLGMTCSVLAQEKPAEKPAGAGTNEGKAAKAPVAAAPAAAKPVGEERNIRFQFDGIPYMDVVERFAQMANKPLLTETNVQGTVTFNDSHPYNYEEALETLNTILAMKHVMLVEADRYLRLVPFKELPQMPLKIFRGLDKTGDVRPGEIVTIVMELKNLEAGETAKAASSMLSSAGSIAPLSRGRGLIITDRLENIRRIKQLLAEIDTSSPVERQMRTYTLLHASGAVVADLINKTFGSATAPKKTIWNESQKKFDVLPPDPEDYVTAVFDEASRTLLLFGPAERIQMAEDLIHRFEDKEGARGGEVKIFYPHATKAEDLARMIRQAIPGVAAENESGSAAATKARVIVDAHMNRLIVTAPIAGQLDAIENLVNRVERSTTGEPPEKESEEVQITKVLRLQIADPAIAFRVLTNAFTRHAPNGMPVQTLKANLDLPTKTIVVTGSPGDVQHAVGIVDQMEDIAPGVGPMETVFLDFPSTSELKRVQPLLEQLYANQVADSARGVAAHAKFLPDPEAKRLIVTANKEHVAIIQKIAAQLRSPALASQPREFRAITLKNTKADQSLKTITDLVNERMNDDLFKDIPKPLILADSPNNRLLITANAAQLKEIDEIVKTVDIGSDKPDRQITAIQLQSLTAAQIIPSLTQLMRPLAEAHPDAASRPEVIPDAAGKNLIVSAVPADFEKIREVVRQLEGSKTDGAARQFKNVRLFNRAPAEVVSLAEQLYREQLKGQPDPSGGLASFVPEAKGNRVIVIGSEPEIARAENIIRQIDPALTKTDKDETRVLRLRNGQAQDLALLVEKTINLEEQKVKLLVDPRSNSVVISGAAAGVAAAAQMVEQLDVLPNTEPKQVRMIDLKSADAHAVVPMLTELLSDVMKNARGSNYVLQSRIVADTNANRVIVTGTADELTQISTLVQRLDTAPQQTDGTRVFQLNSMNASDMAKIVTDAMTTYRPSGNRRSRVSVAADDKSNSLVVTGDRHDLQDVEVMVEKLDGGEKRGSRQVKVIELQTDDPGKLVQVAQQVWNAQAQGRPGVNDVSITLEPSGKRVIVVAPSNLLPQVEQVLTDLDQKPDGTARSMQVVELKRRSATTILPLVTRLYDEESKGKKARPATIVPENSGKRLIIYGSEEQANAIREIVNKLESGAATGDRETRLFDVGQPDDVTRILPLVQQLYHEQMKDNDPADAADAQILGDEHAGRLIVTARPAHLKKIEQIVAQLVAGKLAPKQRETRVYNLNSTTADELVQMVRTVYQQEVKKRPEISKPEALILPDAMANRIIISGATDELELIEEIVKKLDQVSAQTGNTRTFELKHAQADQVATLLSTTLTRWTPSGRVQPRITVGIDPNNNTLIISGQPADLAAASTIVEKLDSNAEGSTKQLRIFPIHGRNAADFASRLKQLYIEQVKSAPDNGPADALILADSPTDRLIVTASEKQLPLLEKLITDLDQLAADNEQQLRLFTLKYNSNTAVNGIIREMFSRNVGRTDPGERLVVTPGIEANTLVAEAPKPILDRVAKLIEQIDTPSQVTAGRQTKILNIGSVEELQRLSPLVQQLYREQLRGQETTDPADAQFIPDSAGGRLIVTARTNQIQQIEGILSQLRENKEAATSDYETRIYNLTSSTASDLAQTVNTLYQEELKKNPSLSVAKALILPDPTANRLIVSGSKAQLGSIEQIIKDLDQVSPQTGGSRVFKLKSADASQVATVLSTALVHVDQNTMRSIPRVSVGADTNNNSLVVSGDAKDLNAAAQIIEQLDNSTERKERRLRMIALKSGRAQDIVMKVRALYLDHMKNDPASGPANALILSDSASDRLIITATDAQIEIIQKIVAQLDEAVSPDGRQVAVRPLKKSSATSIAAILQQFFARNIASQDPAHRLIVSIAPDDRSLILEAPEDLLTKVNELADTLESRFEKENVQVRSYQLVDTQAAELAPSLARLYAQRRPNEAALQPRFEADSAGNILLVAASPEQFEEINKLIDEVKANAEVSNEIRSFRLVNADAEEVVPVLSAMLKAEDPALAARRRVFRPNTPSDAKAVHVAAAAAVNSLVVQGPPSALKTAEQIIRSLDSTEVVGKTVVQTVRLKKATADTVAEAVNKALASRGPKSNLQRATVTPVANSNSLLIDGPAESVQDVMKIIQDLDSESTGGDIEIRVYKLEHGKARELSTLITRMLDTVLRESFRRTRSGRGGGAGGGGGTGGFSISADERTNTLIISATPEEFKTIEQLLVTLDQNSAKADRSVRFVLLKNARATEAASRLNLLFESRPRAERPVIESDSFANSVTIIGSKSDIAEAESVISELDQVSRDQSVQVRMLVVDNVPATQMAKMLQSLYSQMSQAEIQIVDRLTPPLTGQTNQVATNATGKAVITLSVDRTANALLMSGPSHELDAINGLVNDLTFSTVGNEAEFRQFILKEADPVAVAKTLSELFKPEPTIHVPQQGQQPPQVVTPQARMTIVPEPRTRSIIVRAKATDFILLESLLEQLDVKSSAAQLAYRLIKLENADPAKVLPLVQQMITQLGLTKPGDPVSVAGDPRTHSIFAVGRESMLDEVQKVIKGLDNAPAFADAEVTIIPLKNAVASQLATMLQNMLKPAAANESTPEGRELQEQIRSLRITNDDGKQVVLDLSKPIKVMADGAAGTHNGNRLILSSTADNIKALSAVVEMMDVVALTEGVTFKVVRLENADATTVAGTLTQIFTQGQRLATGPAGPAEPASETGKALSSPLNISPDHRSNSLILSGKAESIALAQRLIRDLDAEYKGFVTEVRLFRLNYASAIRLAPLLQSVFTEASPVPGSEGLAMQVTRLQTILSTNTLDGKTTLQPKIRSALTIQADDPSNTLIVAARGDMMPLIQDVIHSMDIPAASGMDTIRIYPLKNADASRLLKVLSDIYAARGALMRPEEKPALTIDSRTNALIVSGNERVFSLVETLIMQLDKDVPFQYGEFRVIKLENADATVVASSLQQIVNTRAQQQAALTAQSQLALHAIVIADPRINSIIVGGSSEVFELVEALAKQLDAPGVSLAGQVRLIPLKFANAGALATSLNGLFTQRYQAARSADPQRNRPIILPDPRINALLVSAGVEDSKALDELLKQLDQKLENPALQIEVIGLKTNDAARVATMIQTIFAGRLQAMTLPGQTANPEDRVVVSADPLSNALIVLANKENLETIRGLVTKVDAEPGIEGGTITMIPLQKADANRVAAMLRTLTSQGLYRPGLMTGGGGGGGQRSREAMAIAVDSRSNTLIVSASPENLAIIREIVKQIDSTDYSLEGDIRLYTLKHARASQLAQTLQQFFNAKRTGEMQGRENERVLPVTITADDRVNTLLVTGGKEAFDAVERMLQQLDSADVYDKINFRVITLKNSTATKLQSNLTRLFANRPPRITGKAPDPITVVADSWVNALLIGASADDMDMVVNLIQTMDNTQPENGMQVQVIPIAKGDANSIAQTVRSLYRDATGGAVSVQVSVDDRLNALIISAGEADLKRITELVQKLDTSNVARVSEIRIFPLKFAQATELAQVLTMALTGKPAEATTQPVNPNRQSMLQFITRTAEGGELVASALKESLLVTADARRNALVISAPVDSMNLLAKVVASLDSESPQLAKIKVFKLVNADARQMADVLVTLFRLKQQPGVPPNQRAIQYTLVREGGSDPAGEGESYTATIGSAEQSALTVTIDLRTNSLLLGGTDHYVGLASEIIEELDSSPALERKTEVYRLKNSQARDIEAALKDFLQQERQRVTNLQGETLGPAAAGPTSAQSVGTALAGETVQELVEREVAVVAETNSNTLLLSASPRYFERFKELINDLDQPQAQVLIQVILAEVTLTKTSDLGVEWSITGSKNGTKITTGTDFGVQNDLKNLGGFSSAITGGNVNFLVRALEADGRLEVLSRPQILTADNQKATIDVGDRVPLANMATTSALGNTTTSYTYENVGVSLTVTPKISPDGFVKMEIEPTVSQLSDQSVNVGPGLNPPIISQRKATTTVSIQSGQSVIIGGLISTTDNRTRRKVPFLGNIPYIGVLFRSSHATADRKELLIILTPQLLLTPGDGRRLTTEGLRHSTIPDEIRRDKLQKEILQPIIPMFEENAGITNAPPTETNSIALPPKTKVL